MSIFEVEVNEIEAHTIRYLSQLHPNTIDLLARKDSKETLYGGDFVYRMTEKEGLFDEKKKETDFVIINENGTFTEGNEESHKFLLLILSKGEDSWRYEKTFKTLQDALDFVNRSKGLENAEEILIREKK